MRARTNVPLKERKTLVLSDFKGVDFSSSPLNVQKNRASFARNFINENGVNKKRNGWKQLTDLSKRINGVFKYTNGNYEKIIVYAGTRFYAFDKDFKSPADITPTGIDLDDNRIQVFLNKGRAYIIGCGDYLVYGTWDDGNSYKLCRVADDEDTYIPTTTISIDDDSVEDTTRATLDDVNCLCSRRINQLVGVSKRTWELDCSIDNATCVKVDIDGLIVSNRGIGSGKYGEFLYNDNDIEYGKIGFLNSTITLNYKKTPSEIKVTYQSDENEKNVTLTWDANFSDKWTLDASIDAGTVVEIRLETIESDKATTHIIKSNGDDKLYKVDENGKFQTTPCGSIIRGVENEKGKIELSCLTVPQIENRDNIFVTFYHSNKEYTKRITKCRFGTLFGVEGNTDRVFFSGNPEFKNYDFYSEEGDFTYFSDRNFATLGNDASAVMGYSRLSDSTLVIYKEENTWESGVFYRTGHYETKYDSDGNIVSKRGIFPVRAGSIGEGCVSTYACANFAGDSLMLSSNGVFGIVLTNNITTSERYTRERSRLINERLKKHEDLSEAVGIVYKNRYYLAVPGDDGDCYVADSRFKVYSENNLDNAYDYEWWYWDNVPARVWAEIDGELYFGTKDGRVCVFDDKYTDRLGRENAEGAISLNVSTNKINYFEEMDIPLSEDAKVSFICEEEDIFEKGLFAVVEDYAERKSDCKYQTTAEKIGSWDENMEVYLDHVGYPYSEVEKKYFICNIKKEDCTYSLKNENGEKVDIWSGFRICRLISNKELYITNVTNGSFQLKLNKDAEPLLLTNYNGSTSTEMLIGYFNYDLNVVAEFYTPTFDMGTNESSKTLLKMTISTEPEINGKVSFGYETRSVDKLINARGINVFSFDNLSFQNFSFESGFASSYSVKCNERNFNFIIFRFVSDSDSNCAVNSFTATYKTNKANKGVR